MHSNVISHWKIALYDGYIIYEGCGNIIIGYCNDIGVLLINWIWIFIHVILF